MHCDMSRPRHVVLIFQNCAKILYYRPINPALFWVKSWGAMGRYGVFRSINLLSFGLAPIYQFNPFKTTLNRYIFKAAFWARNACKDIHIVYFFVIVTRTFYVVFSSKRFDTNFGDFYMIPWTKLISLKTILVRTSGFHFCRSLSIRMGAAL